jgi:stage II sporulation protein AA (anti-sigma F factor antagonist)
MLRPRVEVRLVDGALVAEFWDCLRLDPMAVTQLRGELEQHLARKGRPDVVVDLNGVTFAGSAALGGFLAIQKLSRQRGGRVVLCNVDQTVLEVFHVSKLYSVFDFAPDVPAALAKLGTPETEANGSARQPPPAEDTPPAAARPAPLRGRRKPS